MALRYRKSIKLGPGVRLNVGKKSAGLSLGHDRCPLLGQHLRGDAPPPSGTRNRVQLLDEQGQGSAPPRRNSPRRSSSTSRSLGCSPPRTRRRMRAASRCISTGPKTGARPLQAGERRGQEGTVSVSDEFFVGMISIETGDTAGASPDLEAVAASDVELPDPMMRKFGILGSVVIPITERVTAQVEWARSLPLSSSPSATRRTTERTRRLACSSSSPKQTHRLR